MGTMREIRNTESGSSGTDSDDSVSDMMEVYPVDAENFKDLMQVVFNSIEISPNLLIKSITFNPNSQTVIIIGKYLKKFAEEFWKKNPEPKIHVELNSLSKYFKEKYPDLLNFFEEWKPHRQKLIETSGKYADKIDSTFRNVSIFRILTSVADIAGTLIQPQLKFPWLNFVLSNASVFALASLFIEMTSTKRMYADIKRIAHEDQKLFNSMKRWFQQTKELDRAVRNVFPYGLDPDLLRRIDKESENDDVYSKLFMCIVASNAQKGETLFEDSDFLENAIHFSASEFGTHYYNRVILDPILRECYSYKLADETVRISTSLHNPLIIGLDATNILYPRKKTKLLLNAISIYTSVEDLLTRTKSDKSDLLREVENKSRKEFEEISKILQSLKPDDMIP